jgi:hypothetical protein
MFNWGQNGPECLDLSMFTQPRTQGDHAQQWFRLGAGDETVHVVNMSIGSLACLNSFWTFKAW